MNESSNINRRRQLQALWQVCKFNPILVVGIIVGGVVVAGLEGVGLSFIIPLVELVQSSGNPSQQADGIMGTFVSLYQYFNVPFTLGYVVIGVSIVLTVRWTLTFIVRWLRGALSIAYTRELQKNSFNHAIDARIEYFDREGSDDILNAIVTQARYAGDVITQVVTFVEQGLLALMYLGVAFYLAPTLTLFAIAFLGGFSLLFRRVLVSGYELGDRVADANERVQQAAQAGTQGIRDTKLFGLKKELFDNFLTAVNQSAEASITQTRNQQAIQNFYNLLTAVSVFILIYLAITVADMSLASLGVFLFAMFRLGPKASGLNSTFYRIENKLPHLVRTQEFIQELKRNREPMGDSDPVPDVIQSVEFADVEFSYRGQEESALSGVSFRFEKGEFIGFVGRSGGGKSTIVSLLTRMYEPEAGDIRANGRSISNMDIDEWRSKLAVVRQHPFIFNGTLRFNLTIGNRDASRQDLVNVCRIARINEFFDDLPDGFDTPLGEDGVRLSGGQRQRVAIARALLKEADILVLDEATSDLDSNLEKQVQASIESMEHNYAVVGIAHRLSTVENADRIYTVDDGTIIETGEHDELIESGGQYAKLYAIQSQSG